MIPIDRSSQNDPWNAGAAIRRTLQPVRRRCRLQAGLNGLIGGLLIAGLISLTIVPLTVVPFPMFSRMIISTWRTAALLLTAGAVFGLITGLIRRQPLSRIATLVDRYCGLKDLTATALEFSAVKTVTTIQQLQIRAAVGQLQQLNPANVARVSQPGYLPAALAVVGSSVLILAIHSASTDHRAMSVQTPSIVRAATQIEKQTGALESLAAESDSPELAELAEKFRRLQKELRAPEIGRRQALASISELQRSLREQHLQFDVIRSGEQLQSLGQALTAWPELAAAAASLEAGQFDNAAAQFDRRADAGSRKSALAGDAATEAAKRLAEVAEAMQNAGHSELAAAAAQIADDAVRNTKSADPEQLRKLAAEIRRHDRLQKIAKVLQQHDQQLNDVRSTAADADPGKSQELARQPSESTSADPGNARRNGASSESGRSGAGSGGRNAGAASVGNIDGRVTQLESQRQIARLTGQVSQDGDRETRTILSTDATAEVQRAAQKILGDYERQSETAIESEMIPTAHRETIRRYFELLRPAVGESPRTADP